MMRPMFSALCASTCFLFVMLTDSSSAQLSKEWNQCTGREGSAPDVIIQGCTVVIQAGEETGTRMAAAFNNRGVAYRYKGDKDRALADINQAIQLDPNAANHYNNRGIIYRMNGEYDRAISDYDEAIWLKNDYPAAFYNRAITYTEKGEYDKALADFETVLRFDAQNPFALYGRGIARLKKGETEAASTDLAAARAIRPTIDEEFEPVGQR